MGTLELRQASVIHSSISKFVTPPSPGIDVMTLLSGRRRRVTIVVKTIHILTIELHLFRVLVLRAIYKHHIGIFRKAIADDEIRIVLSHIVTVGRGGSHGIVRRGYVERVYRLVEVGWRVFDVTVVARGQDVRRLRSDVRRVGFVGGRAARVARR